MRVNCPIIGAETAPVMRGPLSLSALTLRRAHPVVVGLLRPDLRAFGNRAAAQAAADAEKREIEAIADQHQWRLVTVLDPLGLPPKTEEITDPIDHLLGEVRAQRADAVVVTDHRYLTDRRGRDCLKVVCRECSVATTSLQQLWPQCSYSCRLC